MRKIHGKYPEFSRHCVEQRNAYGISVYDLAYVRRNRAHDLPKVEARRDSARQIEEQLQPFAEVGRGPQVCLQHITAVQKQLSIEVVVIVPLVVEDANRAEYVAIRPSDRKPEI